ncbi:hypothetical protein [Streptomyces lydicus]|uniref:hypothetical protein n=1 Tax=Streptomyces lydicus TaxID=47763 RepID=UPI0037A0E623
MSYTTTEFGTWANYGDQYNVSVEASVGDAISGGDADWRERLEASGAFARIVAEYRDAINAALPERVALAGNDFYGPHFKDDYTWDGELDIAETVQGVDLMAIVERNDPLTLDEIGRDEMHSKAQSPAKVASMAMSRAGVKPFTYLPHPASGRPQALYRAGEVRAALAKRPGRGVRPSKSDS